MGWIKLVVGGVSILALVLGVKHIIDTFEERDDLKASLVAANNTIASRDEAILTLGQEALKAAQIHNDYLTKYGDLKNETDKLRSCIDSKSCGFTIRVRTVTVQAPNGIAGENHTGGTVEGTAELAPDAQRAYFRHRDAIDLSKANFELCLTTLKEWQNDKRCR